MFGLSSAVSAQEMWGISNSNYSGSMGLSLNPSTIVAAPYKYEIRLIAGDVFVHNNLAYLPANERTLIRSASGELVEPNLTMYEGNKKSAFVYGRFLGPSFIYNAGKWAAAVHTALRVETGVLKIPFSISRFAYPDHVNSSSVIYNTSRFSTAAMGWAETGITFGSFINKNDDGVMKWAATLNYLNGFDGMFLGVDNLSYSMDDSSLTVYKMNASYAHAMNYDAFSSRGNGFSTTIGFCYIRTGDQRKESDRPRIYNYRIGASLVDIGKIHFKNDTRYVHLQASNISWNNFNSAKFGSIQNLDTALIGRLEGTLDNRAFNIWLPMALSVQFDYSISRYVYANLSVVNRLHFMPNEIGRPNQAVASIRYERKRFETAFNVNLFQYSQPSFGVAVRFLFFVIGTDRLPELASLSDLRSIDIFFGVKFGLWNIFKSSSHASCPAYKSDAQSLAGL